MTYQYLPAKYKGGKQTKINLIVVHGTVSPCRPGQALNTAKYFQNLSRPSSAHYTVDPETIVQSVPDDVVAYHCGRNSNSLGIELCDPVAGPASRWGDANHVRMLRLATGLIRDLCRKYDVPFVKLSVAQIKAGQRGICGHVDIRDAFPGSTTHHDPGPGFPWNVLLDETITKEEDDMTPDESRKLSEIHSKTVGVTLPLNGRPGPEKDDMYGHVLNADALGRQILAKLTSIETRLSRLENKQ